MVETSPNLALVSTDTLIVDVMPEGFAAEKHPEPLARMAINMPAPSAETVLGQIALEVEDNGQNRFVPYSPEHMKMDAAGDTLVTGITLVDEGGVVKPVLAEAEPVPKSATSRAKELIQSAKRSRTGKAIAATAITAAGVLSLPSTATASGLKQKCATDIFKFGRSQIIDNTMNFPGKESQSININLDFGAVSPACNEHFVRKVSLLPQLIRHGRIINENPGWVPLLQGRGFNYATTAGLLDFNSVHDPNRYWHPGDKARFELRLEELNIQAKKVVNSVTKIEPIQIKRHQ